MHIDYRFPLFDELMQGRLNPLHRENHAGQNYLQRLQEQVTVSEPDKGLYRLTFIRWSHPKTEYYSRLLVGETYVYCNELIICLQEEQNSSIRAYLRDMILDKHLSTCLQRLGEFIRLHQLTLSRLTNPSPEDTPDDLANCYVFQLLKVCVCKAYLEVQARLAGEVNYPLNETMIYTGWLQELPPVPIFLTRQAGTTPEDPDSKKKKKKMMQPAVAEKKQNNVAIPDYMTVKEAAQILRMDERTVRRMLEKGTIAGMRMQNVWRIEKASFSHFLQEKTNQGKRP
ncbi:helix-turn-helix domain-containing protein [Microbacter margulisiae]|uniref:Excisionase family DNA binding protein n=1 Tax=Microbacter margulisiae TaxID=1350067 RepID=A0A7W5DQU0_9PORP|nr:helix-turn-helix domain-containing protein [Microbacter margulisiae]MBB3187379.1 excisionase family DNA binding protein [Microbacter margulisiae]